MDQIPEPWIVNFKGVYRGARRRKNITDMIELQRSDCWSREPAFRKLTVGSGQHHFSFWKAISLKYFASLGPSLVKVAAVTNIIYVSDQTHRESAIRPSFWPKILSFLFPDQTYYHYHPSINPTWLVPEKILVRVTTRYLLRFRSAKWILGAILHCSNFFVLKKFSRQLLFLQ